VSDRTDERTVASRRIVVGVDGSIGSAAAVAWCARMAPLLDADVIAVHAIETRDYAARPSSSPNYPFPDDAWLEHIRAECEKVWCATLDAAGIDVRVVLLNAAAAAALLVVADDVDADMIVVGRRGQGGFEELILGSAPHEVAHHARRPVVIVPAG
jgi:nucleotide-binding universal stress UspA family protein